MTKNKLIFAVLTSTVIFSSTLLSTSSAEASTSDLPQDINLSYNNFGSTPQTINTLSVPSLEDVGAGGTATHTYLSTTTKVLSIEEQNATAAAKSLLIAVAGTKIGTLGYVTYGKLLGSYGTLSTLSILFTGKSGAQYPIRVTTTAYKAKQPTSTYFGYATIRLTNTSTGKTINSKKIVIGKTGI